MQPLFATSYAEWNTLGGPVWIALVVGCVATLLVSRLSPLPVGAQHRLLPWLPGIMLFGCLFIRLINSPFAPPPFRDWYFYKYYYARLDMAFIISLAFGSALTIDLLRRGDDRFRILGFTFVGCYLALFGASLLVIREWYS